MPTTSQEHTVLFPSGELQLVGLLSLPRSSLSPPGVVLCHPHPQYGGDLDNNVVVALADGLRELGYATLRFNFRGVGRSQGFYDRGIGEQDDARAALHYLAGQPGVDHSRLVLAGYSFGATVALAVAASEPRLAAVVAVSLPGARIEEALFRAPDAASGGRPLAKLFLAGTADPLARPEALQESVSRLPPPAEASLAPGVDHFWLGREPWLLERVAAFLGNLLHAVEG